MLWVTLVLWALTLLVATAALLFAAARGCLRRGVLAPKGVPLVGGLVLATVLTVAALLGAVQDARIFLLAYPVLVPSLILLAVGIVDDLRELSVVKKLAGQLFASAVLIALGVRTHIVGIGETANTILTVLWVVGMTNAFNHLDVADGIAGSVAVSLVGALAAVSALKGDLGLVMLLAVLEGALLGFLLFNWPPARVYLGNAGSHFLGFFLAAISLSVRYATLERPLALLSPVLIFGVPLLDTGFLILVRLRKKILPFNKSNDHLALLLLKADFSKRKTCTLMAVWGVGFAAAGILVTQLSGGPALAVVGLVSLASVLWLLRMSRIALHE